MPPGHATRRPNDAEHDQHDRNSTCRSDPRIDPPARIEKHHEPAPVCAALAEGESILDGALASDDTRAMIEGLEQLGVAVAHEPPEATIRVVGCKGRPLAAAADIIAGNSGTTVRFLTAVAALGHGEFRLDGSARMRQRPIEDLLDALGQLGADAVSQFGTGCPPVLVHAAGLPGGHAIVAGDISSQFLSAVLMAAPAAQTPVELSIAGKLVSQPYVEMTRRVMESFGVIVHRDGVRFRIVPSRYRACRYAIEPDASAASYFFAAAAVTGGSVAVEGLSRTACRATLPFATASSRWAARSAMATTRSPSSAARCGASTPT